MTDSLLEHRPKEYHHHDPTEARSLGIMITVLAAALGIGRAVYLFVVNL